MVVFMIDCVWNFIIYRGTGVAKTSWLYRLSLVSDSDENNFETYARDIRQG